MQAYSLVMSTCIWFFYSGQKLADLYEELQTTDTAQHLVTHFEAALSSLLLDVKNLHEDNKRMEEMFARY
jgi:hypothetical protein